MEEAENVDPKYVEGFNQGYYLAKHAPELASKIASISGNNSRIEGIKHGIEEYNLEQSKDRMPDWLKKKQINESLKENDKGKLKDDIDRE